MTGRLLSTVLGVLLLLGGACGWSDPGPQAVVTQDRVASRATGFDAELVLPRIVGLDDLRRERGVSVWLQQPVRRLMGGMRTLAERQPAGGPAWTVRAAYTVTHSGSQYLSLVQRVTVDRGEGPEVHLFPAILRRSDAEAVFLPDLLAPGGPGWSTVQAAVEAVADGIAPPADALGPTRPLYLTDEELVLVFGDGELASAGEGPREAAVPLPALAGAWADGAAPR